MAHEDDLRAWAKGDYTVEAATELLIRAFSGRYAAPGRPWIRTDEHTGKPWFDFEAIRESIRSASGGERRVLLLAASLAANVPVVLGDVIPDWTGTTCSCRRRRGPRRRQPRTRGHLPPRGRHRHSARQTGQPVPVATEPAFRLRQEKARPDCTDSGEPRMICPAKPLEG
jgi:hypothetical protein